MITREDVEEAMELIPKMLTDVEPRTAYEELLMTRIERVRLRLSMLRAKTPEIKEREEG